MKKQILLFTTASVMLMTASCTKEEVKAPDFAEKETLTIQNFTKDVALRSYSDLNNAAVELHSSIVNLNIGNYEWNLQEAKSKWIKLHNQWELTESMHFGPVADNKLDSRIDAWPINTNDVDNLMAGGDPLTVSDIEKLPVFLKGFHSLEYILFGADGKKKVEDLTGREKEYMVSLSKDLSNICQTIYSAWSVGENAYSTKVFFAGDISKTFETKKQLMLVMTAGMNDLCKKVLNSSFSIPYNSIDSFQTESPFSNNSLYDIKNNMISLQNVYSGRYNGSQGYGLTDLVKDKNAGLDTKIKDRITAVDNAVNLIAISLDKAIYNQRPELKTAMDAVDSLRSTIDMELKPFINNTIQD